MFCIKQKLKIIFDGNIDSLFKNFKILILRTPGSQYISYAVNGGGRAFTPAMESGLPAKHKNERYHQCVSAKRVQLTSIVSWNSYIMHNFNFLKIIHLALNARND